MQTAAYQSILHLARPLSRRHPMAVERRAKQFAPFAALRGFEEEVHKKEICYEEKRILPEEQKNELDMKMRMIRPGIRLKVEYFQEDINTPGIGQYHTIEGNVDFFDNSSYLCIGDTEIRILDIYEMSGEIFDVLELPC